MLTITTTNSLTEMLRKIIPFLVTDIFFEDKVKFIKCLMWSIVFNVERLYRSNILLKNGQDIGL